MHIYKYTHTCTHTYCVRQIKKIYDFGIKNKAWLMLPFNKLTMNGDTY